MREGGPGNQFAVLLNGAVSIERDGSRVNELERGSYFGEVALLPHVAGTDGHRIASVTTLSRVEVAVCSFQEFRALIGAQPGVRSELEARAEALLN